MKQLILTGLSSEHRFGSNDIQYQLVFNDGEIRIPVSEEAANAVSLKMYEESSAPQESEEEQEDSDDDSDYENDSDIPQL